MRKVLRKAAHVIRKEAQANVPRIVADPNVGGKDESSGLHEKSIKVVKGRAHKTLNGERMFVMIRKAARYPVDERTPTGIGVATVGKMLEYGTSKRQPMPWARPAFHAKKQEAVDTIVRELPKEIDKIVAKLSRGG